MSENTVVTPELLEEICGAFNRHDVDAILSYFADECEWIMARGPDAPWGRRCVGKAEIGEVLRARFAVIRDMRWVDTRHWVMGDKALSEWRVQGTGDSGEREQFRRNGRVIKTEQDLTDFNVFRSLDLKGKGLKKPRRNTAITLAKRMILRAFVRSPAFEASSAGRK